MPGCGLRATPDFGLPFVPTGPDATWSLALPMQGLLAGCHLYATSVVWTATAGNAANGITSNGIDARLGM